MTVYLTLLRCIKELLSVYQSTDSCSATIITTETVKKSVMVLSYRFYAISINYCTCMHVDCECVQSILVCEN